MGNREGAIYVATGAKHIMRAVRSASSLKQVMPGIHVSIFADEPVEHGVFDAVIPVEVAEHDMMDKIRYMRLTPYDRSLFLDADTFVCDDVSELFVLLERFDLAVAQDTYRIYSYDYEILKNTSTKSL
ncbi:MAG: hypothetical protein M5R40_20340 [Anaerolineae bacterium]|nr:hypothetical protein [Anaerolineae bacterium]